jgi:ubiquinone/menaquinone biosynthesis C-methylase UbiE
MDRTTFLPILEQRVAEVYGRDHPYYRAWSTYFRTRGDRLEKLIACLARRLPFAIRDAIVLDIGCGTGSATVELARLEARVIGIDMDDHFGLDLAKRRTHDEPVLALLKADALGLPVPDESVDFCFSFNAIEHFPDYRRAIAEMYRVTRPGGAIYVETPNKTWPWEAHTQLLFAGWLPPHVADVYVKLRGKRRWSDKWDVHPISYRALRRTLEQVGFSIIADFAELIDYNTSLTARVLRRAAEWNIPIQLLMQNIKLLAHKPASDR